jgi:HEAT repeat protein
MTYFEELGTAEALPALCKTLKHKKSEARLAAADGLAKLGAGGQKAVPQLGAAWKIEKDPKVRGGLIKALIAVDPKDRVTIEAVQEALLDSNEVVRGAAIAQMDRLNSESLISFLALKLDDESQNSRNYATSALARMGPNADLAIPALVKALKANGDASFRLVLLKTLIAIDPRAKKSKADLNEALTDEDAAVRQAAATQLISVVYRTSIPDLCQALEHPSVEMRVGAARALGDLGPKAKDAIPSLAKALKSSMKDSLRLDLLKAVIAIDPDAKISKDVLDGAATDTSAVVRQEAANQLITVCYRSSIPDLSKALEHSSLEMRTGAARALGALGPKAKDAVPALNKAALASSNPDERMLIQDALFLVALDALPLAGRELIEFLPEDTDLVVSLKVQTLLDSVLVDTGFLKSVRKKLKDECPILDQFQFDPLKDVAVMTVASGNIDPTNIDDAHFHFLLNGRIGKERVFNIAKGRMFGRDAFAACIDEGSILACDEGARLEQAIGHKKNKSRAKPNVQLIKILARVDSLQTFWLAKAFSKRDVAFIESLATKGIAESSLGLSLHVNYKENATVAVRIFTADAKTAAFWEEKVKEWKDLAIKFLPDFYFADDAKLAQQVKEVIESAKIETKGSDLFVQFSIKADVLEKVAKRFQGQR